ncbi:BTB domain-containing protein [Favolaschia claudopus]|uniref:BTB domain-containing protein n=1 Tax=Favolaschia claudopus TaxID=2862362 RepID=A0AAW0BFP0_9AGAR
MSSPPTKRQRTEDEPITRSDTWFPDGNVVLQARNTQFRVHWGVLTLHSSVFSDMQGLPQPPEQPSVEGCPVVELQDDEEDLKFLLKALYTPTFLGKQKIPFSAVAALVRLGRKYEFQDLYDSAVGRLTASLPATLEEYDALKPYPDRWSTFDSYRGIHFDVIALATEHDLFKVLPCAYVEMACFYITAALFDEIQNRNGSRTRTLSGEYLRKCVLFQQALSIKQYQPSYSHGWLRKWEFEADCAAPKTCRAVRESVLGVCMDNAFVISFTKMEKIPILKQCCSKCVSHLCDSIDSGRKKMWDELPGLLGLPPWDELENSQ